MTKLIIAIVVAVALIALYIQFTQKENFGLAANSKIKGYYLWTWKAPHVDGKPEQVVLPESYNMAILFSGWGTAALPVTQYQADGKAVKRVPLTQLFDEIPDDKPLLICNPKVENPLNLLNVGGGSNCTKNEKGEDVCAGTGDWTIEALEPTAWMSIIASTKKRGYNGFCFDLEQGRRTVGNDDKKDVLPPETFDPIFKMCKDAGMYVMLSCSWFGVNTWGFENVAALRNSWLSAVESGRADIFSPQLYDVKPCGTPWDGKKTGEKQSWGSDPTLETLRKRLVSLGSKLVPTINDRETVNGINNAFPNNGGYIMYCQEQKDKR
jgi:hypothetical protein